MNLDIYNIRGQKIRTLVNEIMDAGHHEIIWNGTNDNARSMASGIYLYRLNAGGRL